MTDLILVDVHGPDGGLRILGLQVSRSATRPGVEREAGHVTPLGVPGSFPAAGDICGTTTTTA